MTAGELRLRCPECGRLSVRKGHCDLCSHPSVHLNCSSPEAREIQAFHSSGLVSRGAQSSVTARRRNADDALMHPTGSLVASKDVPIRTRAVAVSTNSVSGRIIWVNTGRSESMDFDPWRWLAIPVWGLLLLLAPVLVTFLVWQMTDLLIAFAAGLVCLLVVRHVFSHRVLHAWHLVSALNGRHIVEPMPVTMLRVRGPDEREHQLRLKGHINGLPVEGDRILAEGHWRNGVFQTHRLQCLRTGAVLTPKQPCDRSLALTGLALLMLSLLWLWFDAVPRAVAGLQAWQRSSMQEVSTFQNQFIRR